MLTVLFELLEWFSARRGLAGSIIFGGSGLGGALFPVSVNYLLTNLGFRWVLKESNAPSQRSNLNILPLIKVDASYLGWFHERVRRLRTVLHSLAPSLSLCCSTASVKMSRSPPPPFLVGCFLPIARLRNPTVWILHRTHPAICYFYALSLLCPPIQPASARHSGRERNSVAADHNRVVLENASFFLSTSILVWARDSHPPPVFTISLLVHRQ